MPGSFAPEFDTPSRSSESSLALTFDRPVRAMEPMRVRNSANVAVYEAGAQTRRTATWNAPTTSPNSGVLSNLATLRDRSRAAIRNNAYAKAIIDRMVSNLIGSGIRPLSRAGSPELRRAIETLWNQWAEESSPNGALGWLQQQSQIARAWFESGDVFTRIRIRDPQDGFVVPLQVQVIEAEFCPHWHSTFNGLNRIKAGIEFNGVGQRVRYWMYRERPGAATEMDTSRLVSVPADEVCHVFDEARPGQLRGIPLLTQALIGLNEIDKLDDAALLRHQIGNLFAGFVKRTPSTVMPMVDPLTGEVSEKTDDDKPMVTLEPGIMQELSENEDVTFADPPAPPATYGDFMRYQLIRVGAATGCFYEIMTGDYSHLNDRTARVLLNDFRRNLGAMQQRFIYQLCVPVWYWWMKTAVDMQLLPIRPAEFAAHPDRYTAAHWTPEKHPYLNPVQDVEAQKEAIRNGLTSRSAIVSANGDDPETIDEEQAADNERADTLGVKYDSDGRNPSTGAVPPPDPTEDPAPPAGRPKNSLDVLEVSAAPQRLEIASAPMRIVRDAVGRPVRMEMWRPGDDE